MSLKDIRENLPKKQVCYFPKNILSASFVSLQNVKDLDLPFSSCILSLTPSLYLHPDPRMSPFLSPARCRGIPPDTPHSVIVSLPEWDNNVGLATGNKTLFEWSETTYPPLLAPGGVSPGKTH